MSDPEYADIGDPATILMEECGELIQAISKVERFGPENVHPEKPMISNLKQLRMEWADLQSAYYRYMEKIKTQLGW